MHFSGELKACFHDRKRSHPSRRPPGELYIPGQAPSMIVPADAVVFDENGLHVAVVKNGVVHMQKISIARDFGTQVEVHDGVKPGDQGILHPMLSLTEGSRVSAHGPKT